eukprot:TRINITY_DN12386_c0_g1_i1.p1 TRINITY_DN12386_c0_g1~~TRINITY_DN12386_c0_g1_i1.p1  ORF type:complete len:333 (-),score=73.93 TRINITY_DN12386_c0_g1_i1:101-1099(-)
MCIRDRSTGDLTRNLMPEQPHPDGPPLVHEGYTHRLYHGVVYPPFVVPSAVDQLREQLSLPSDDVVIATYPKCGTTWMQQIALLLRFKGDRTAITDPMAQAPWFESMVSSHAVAKPAESCLCAGMHPNDWRALSDTPHMIWKTHAPAQLVPWSNGLHQNSMRHKVIVVTRNSKDAAVSMLHHANNGPHGFVAEWPEFAQLFKAGMVESGSYWTWHADWWAAKAANPESILWVTFESLKSDLRTEVGRIAEFMGCELDSDTLDLVAEGSTFEAMKQQQQRIDAEKEARGARVKKDHIRKGKVGTWRELFEPEVSAEFDALDLEHGAADWAQLL